MLRGDPDSHPEISLLSVVFLVDKTNIHCVSIKSLLLYFSDNFAGCKPIQIIFGRNIADKIINKLTHGDFYIYSLCVIII